MEGTPELGRLVSKSSREPDVISDFQMMGEQEGSAGDVDAYGVAGTGRRTGVNHRG